MKIDIKVHFPKEDLKTFPQLKTQDVNIVIDTDYVDDEYELVSAIADEIYHQYDIVIPSGDTIRKMVVNFYGVVEEIFS